MAGYGTDEGFTAYATAAGYTVPAGTISAARQRGSVYIDGVYGARFVGAPTGGLDQDRAWPRTGASVWGVALADNLIPIRVVSASYEAALIELQTPGSLSVTVTADKRVKRQKVDTIEREFFEPGSDAAMGAVPVLTAIEGLLEPLLTTSADLPAILIV